MRLPKPWVRASDQHHYVTINGTQHKLGRDPEEVRREYARLLAQKVPSQETNVRRLLRLYWKWVKQNRARTTAEGRKRALVSFDGWVKSGLKVSQLRPFHIQRWLGEKFPNAGVTYQATLITTIKGAFEWAHRLGYTDHNPVAKMPRPTPAIRQDFVPPDRWGELLQAATDDGFRDFLEFMLLTGARPEEMFRVEARHWHGDRIVFPREESKGRKRSRVIYMPPAASEIVARLATEYPEGPLFRNRRGRGWTKNSVRCRFRRIKKIMKIPGLCATSLRHSFAHYRLVSGQDSLIVSKLMGHVDGRMLATRYGHLDQASEYLISEASRITPPNHTHCSSPIDSQNPQSGTF